MEDLIIILYAFNGVIAAVSYIPQLLKLWKNKKAREAISIKTWLAWQYTSVVTFFYSFFIIEDLMLSLVTLILTVGNGLILAFGINGYLSKK